MKWMLLAMIDRYRARVVPHCTVCQTTPEQSFSYRTRQRVVTHGTAAGLFMLFTGWLTHMGAVNNARYRSGGW